MTLAACSAAAPAREPPAGYDFPTLTGRVVDQADLIPADAEAQLVGKLEAVERSSKHQFVIVTVKSLGGHAIEDYGVTLGRWWGIGRRDVNDGVLLIVAPNEHKVRIEVGYGLEKALRDEEAGRIIETDLLPQFRSGQFAQGIAAGAEAIIDEIMP